MTTLNPANDAIAGRTAALAEARRRVAGGDTAALEALARDIDAVLGRGDGSDLTLPAMLSLLDELQLLVDELELAQARAASDIRAAMRHKRAGSAYAGAGQQP